MKNNSLALSNTKRRTDLGTLVVPFVSSIRNINGKSFIFRNLRQLPKVEKRKEVGEGGDQLVEGVGPEVDQEREDQNKMSPKMMTMTIKKIVNKRKSCSCDRFRNNMRRFVHTKKHAVYLSVRSKNMRHIVTNKKCIAISEFFLFYSRDLNRELVWYSNGPKQFARRMVRHSSHDLNSELIVCYSGHRVFD